MVEAASYIWPWRQRRRSQPQLQNRRVGRIHFAPVRIARKIGGKLAARRVDGRLNVARRRVDIAVQIELQRDAGRAQRAATTSSH